MLKRGLWVAPVLVLVAGADLGRRRRLRRPPSPSPSCSSTSCCRPSPCSWAAKISPTALMAIALGGFLVRMGLVTARRAPRAATSRWIDLPALAVTMLVTHLGLLFWETRYVSASLAFPGLKPGAAKEARTLVIFGLEFPPISHVIEWPDIFGSGPFAVNKVVLLMWLSVVDRLRRSSSSPAATASLVPTGVQNVAESAVDFIAGGHHPADDGPRRPARGRRSCSRCSRFIFVCNIWEIIPGRPDAGERPHRPAAVHGPARLGASSTSSASSKQGPIGYFKNIVLPAGRAEGALHPGDARSSSCRRSSSGRSRLASDSSPTCWPATCSSSASPSSPPRCSTPSVALVIWPFSFVLLVALTGFEVLVAFLQAYIFTILTAVYIGSSMHPEH